MADNDGTLDPAHNALVLPPAASDQTSVHGLAAFARRHPGAWDYQVRCVLPELPEDLLQLDVIAALRTELADQLAPRSPSDLNRVRRYRASARRLVEVAGDELMSDVDEAFMLVIRDRLTRCCQVAGFTFGAEDVGRDLSLLRHTARRWAYAAAIDPLVAERPPKRVRRRKKPAKRRRQRVPPTIQQVLELLLAADPQLRAAIGLAVGGGLQHGEITELRLSQLDPRTRAVSVWARGTARQPAGSRAVRVVWIAAWAWQLLERVLPRGAARGARVFPSRFDASRGRTGFDKALRKACEAAWGPQGPRYTMGALRTSWQAVARTRGLPRAVVRGSWAMPPGGTPPRPALEARELARSWDELFWGPAVTGVLEPVPARAPRRGGPWEPELVEEEELPDSCLPMA